MFQRIDLSALLLLFNILLLALLFMKNNVEKKYFSKNQFKDATKMSDDKSYVLDILNESTLPHYSFHKLHM